MGLFSKLFGSYSDRELRRIMPIAKAVEDREAQYAAPRVCHFGKAKP